MPGAVKASSTMSVIFINLEDDQATTTRPRLEAAGADLTRVFLMDGTKGDRFLSLPDDTTEIERLIVERKVGLLVIDPLAQAASGKIKLIDDQSVRQMLAPLTSLARRTDAAIIVVAHLNKKEGLSAESRVSGAGSIVAAPRIVWLAGRDRQNQDQTVLAQIKNNLAPRAQSWRYGILDSIGAPVVQWQGKTDATAANLTSTDAKHSASKLDEAVEWLATFLVAGARPAIDVFAAADQAGFSQATIKRAKKELGIKPHKVTGKAATWMWALPPDPTPETAADEELASQI